jgi:hypothetical protein
VAQLAKLEGLVDAPPDSLLQDPASFPAISDLYPLPNEIKTNSTYVKLANDDLGLFSPPLKPHHHTTKRTTFQSYRDGKKKIEKKKSSDKYQFYAWQLKIKARPISEYLPTAHQAITTKDWQVCRD